MGSTFDQSLAYSGQNEPARYTTTAGGRTQNAGVSARRHNSFNVERLKVPSPSPREYGILSYSPDLRSAIPSSMSVPNVFRIGLLFLVFLVFSAVPTEAKDQWLQIRSKNFFLIGNASEKDVRKVAARLEQFRESFRLLFGIGNLNSAVPTTVVVFKNSGSI